MRGIASIMLFLLGVMDLGFLCEKSGNNDFKTYRAPSNIKCLCDKLNQNVLFYVGLVKTYKENGMVDFFTMESENGLDVTYSFSFGGSGLTHYSSFSDKEQSLIPQVSFYKDGDDYYWVINGNVLIDKEGRQVALNGEVQKLVFKVNNNSRWLITTDGKNWHTIMPSSSQNSVPKVSMSSKCDFVVCDVSDTLQIIVPTSNLNNTIKNGVPIQGFYKDIFMDAGVYLTTRKKLAAASYLGYSLESVTCTNIADTLWQNAVIGGDSEDENGRLLYPDGAPRYKILFVCGGSSKSHGKTLRKSREMMRTFVRNGGGYVGTCAGAFLVSNGYDTVDNYPYYLHLWPGVVNHTGLVQTSTGMFIEKGSPLLRYYSFGGDNYVKNIRHNKGGMPSSLPQGTEVLARYDYPPLELMHGQPSAWAYKRDNTMGRIIMEGSHPEEVSSGERRDFTAAMLRYAADGVGETTIKGLLRNGEVREMDKTTGEKNAAYTRIGDMQYHHFAVYIPKDAKNIKFTVSSEIDCDLQLCLHSTTFAYSDIAEYKSKEKGHYQELLFDGMSEGLWYVSIRCLTTVESTDFPLGQVYSGKLEVLNGIPYSVSVTWD